MERLVLKVVVVFTFCAGLPLSAEAADYIYSANITVTPSDVIAESQVSDLEATFAPNQPQFTLAAGDSVSGTLTLSAPILVTLEANQDVAVVLLFSQSNGQSTLNFSATFTLLGLSGASLPSSATASFTGNAGGHGISGGVDYGGPASFSFTGFSYDITLNSLTSSGSAVYEPFGIDVSTALPNEITVVPEPASCALLVSSLFFLAVASAGMRRQAD
jgi:hypothetical protein